MKKWTKNDLQKSACATLNADLLKEIPAEKRSYEEDDLQRACIKWFQWQHPELWRQKKLHHIPNGGHRTPAEAAIFSAMGVMPGVSDLMLTIPGGKYAGAFFELKSAKGKLSEHQELFIETHKQDYYCSILRSLKEFIEQITIYLTWKHR